MEEISVQEAAGSPRVRFQSLETPSEGLSPEPQFLQDTDMEQGLTGGACAFLALLLHALEIQNLRMQPNPPQVSVQWPYYVLGFGILLFIAAGVICLFQEACHRCHLLRISQSMTETRESPYLEILESLGGGLSALQKEILLKEETVI